jgi:DNA invertase Pin-like site-specific DNA recombinase
VLAFVSERERDNILQRQAEGIKVAKAQGKLLGRPQLNLSTLNKEQRQLLEKNYQKWKNKEITAVIFMSLLELKKNAFYKIIGEYEQTM